MSPYDPTATELGNFTYAGKLAWFQFALEGEELAAAQCIPIATLESLYPEVASFGPGGFGVQSLKEDWLEKGYLSPNRTFFVEKSLADFGFLHQTATLTQFDDSPGELISNVHNLVMQLDDRRISKFELDVLDTMFRWLVVDGFLMHMEEFPVAFTWTLGDYRGVFRELAEAVGLKGNDYLGCRVQR